MPTGAYNLQSISTLQPKGLVHETTKYTLLPSYLKDNIVQHIREMLSYHTTTYTATMGVAMYGPLQGWYFEQKPQVVKGAYPSVYP